MEVIDKLVSQFEEKNQIKMIGSGSFGSIYKVNMNPNTYSVKQMFYNMNDGFQEFDKKTNKIKDKTPAQKEYINMMNNYTLREIEGLKYAGTIDTKHYFFIKTYGAFEMATFNQDKSVDFQLIDLENEQKTEDEKKIIQYLENVGDFAKNKEKEKYFEDPAWFVMNYLEMSMGDFLINNLKRGSMTHFGTRLEIILNIAMGLKLMQDKYYHCDIKSKNIMFRELSKEQQDEVKEMDKNQNEQDPKVVPLLMQLGGRKQYVVQIIDIGNDEKSGEYRKCGVGTPGFVPVEYKEEKNKVATYNDDKHDVFSLFTLLFDMEYNELGFHRLSDYNNEYYNYFVKPQVEAKYKDESLIKKVRTKNLLLELSKKDQGFDLYYQKKDFLDIEKFLEEDDKNLKTFIDSVKKVYPDFEKNAIQKIQTDNDSIEVENKKILETKKEKEKENENNKIQETKNEKDEKNENQKD